MIYQQRFNYNTRGRGTYELSLEIDNYVRKSGIKTGICSVFIHHTSASLMITENADPTVRTDLETIMQRLAPDGDPEYRHDDEGPDDMAAHIRCVLTNDSVTVPVTRGHGTLGTWQGIYLYEHRTGNFQRRLTVTIMGE